MKGQYMNKTSKILTMLVGAVATVAIMMGATATVIPCAAAEWSEWQTVVGAREVDGGGIDVSYKRAADYSSSHMWWLRVRNRFATKVTTDIKVTTDQHRNSTVLYGAIGAGETKHDAGMWTVGTRIISFQGQIIGENRDSSPGSTSACSATATEIDFTKQARALEERRLQNQQIEENQRRLRERQAEIERFQREKDAKMRKIQDDLQNRLDRINNTRDAVNAGLNEIGQVFQEKMERDRIERETRDAEREARRLERELEAQEERLREK
jgi:hypothetical protein